MDWKAILHRIRPGGKLCLVGLPPNDISFHARDVIMSQVSVCGSLIGNRATIRDMLKFAQLHNIRYGCRVRGMWGVHAPHHQVHMAAVGAMSQAGGGRAAADAGGGGRRHQEGARQHRAVPRRAHGGICRHAQAVAALWCVVRRHRVAVLPGTAPPGHYTCCSKRAPRVTVEYSASAST